MAQFKKECRDCGDEFIARQHSALFCDDECRGRFNRRRRDRGAILYDAMMAAHFDKADERPDRTVPVRLLDAFRTSDQKLRSGRASWQPWQYAQMRLPMAYGTEGDKK